MKNSKSLKASSGFDAISQSVESLISRKSSNKSVNYAKKSLEILFKSYPLYLKEATLDRSLKMLIGSDDCKLIKKIGNWEIELLLEDNFVEETNYPDWYGYKRIDKI